MTFEEALTALKEGKKIRRKEWEDYEYIELDGKKMVSQYGNPCGMLVFDLSTDCWEEYKGDILDKEENEYLSAVIKPFRNRVRDITKLEIGLLSYSIVIRVHMGFTDNYYSLYLPPFKKTSDMYKKMNEGKHYTLKELGL